MKTAVVSVVVGEDWKKVGDVSVPTFENYAKRIGADFKLITEYRICPPEEKLHGWEKLQIRDLLKTYDRVIHFDADSVVRGDTPSLFDVVPQGTFGGFCPTSAYVGSNGKDWYAIHFKNFKLPPIEHDGRFCNTGVMVLDRAHLPILQDPPFFPHQGSYEEPWINIGLQRTRLPITELSWKFNSLPFVRWGFRPLQSHVIHIQKMGRGLHTWDTADVLSEWREAWKRMGF